MPKTPFKKECGSDRHKRSRSRTRSETELVWGIHPVMEALAACPQAVKEIIVHRDRPGRRVEQIVALAQDKDIPVSFAPEKVGSGSGQGYPKTGKESGRDAGQGVSARIRVPPASLDELLGRLKERRTPPLLLALDSIQDPHNLGAIIRSAVAAGADGVILPKDRSASITGTVIKVSAGSVFHIDICPVTNLVSSFKILKDNGFWIFGTTGDGDRIVYDADLTVPACIVIGSESKGLRPLVAEQCDLTVTIPMQGSLDSLNASVAAGIVLFEVVRQRRTQHT